MKKYDPQQSGVQYLEDMATAYWSSEVLFTAVELEVFRYLEAPGMPAAELAAKLDCDSAGLQRLLEALASLGLLSKYQDSYTNSILANKYLRPDQPGYQGNSILWRQHLGFSWRELAAAVKTGGRMVFADNGRIPNAAEMQSRRQAYIAAMDDMAQAKAGEVLAHIGSLPEHAQILDVGAGSGALAAAFLQKFPQAEAVLIDIPEIIEITHGYMSYPDLSGRVSLVAANILEPWPDELQKQRSDQVLPDQFDLIIMSNIVHAFAEADVEFVFAQAVPRLKDGGMIILHDFFSEHFPIKSALFDLNMLINTYNGQSHSTAQLRQMLIGHGLEVVPLIALESDTGLLVAAKPPLASGRILMDGPAQLIAKIAGLGFSAVTQVAPSDVVVSDWVAQRCRFGCSHYGQKHCPPHSPSADQTRKVLSEFSFALLLEGEPPGRDFQKSVLAAERLAFAEGYYKAFAYWAGPCALCPHCAIGQNAEPGQNCARPADARPSMEGSGIDVFSTVRKFGNQLKTLGPDDHVKYYGLLLVE